MTEDPRLGLPSASSFALDALCPGRNELLREVAELKLVEIRDEDAERGTRLHAAWEKDDPSKLDTEDTEIYERGVKLADQTVFAWRTFLEAKGQMSPAIKEMKREERYWYHDRHGNLALSGQPDRVYVSKPYGLAIDFKSLWCRSLVAAEWNWQARVLVALTSDEFDLNHVRFAFLKAMFGVKDVVDYGAEDIERAKWGIDQVLWEQKRNPVRRSGAYCRHCNACTVCPEAAAFATLPSFIAADHREDANITPAIAKQLVANLSLDDCIKVWESTTARHNIEDACKGRIKQLDPLQLAERGLQFADEKFNWPITNPSKALKFLNTLIKGDRLWTAVGIGNAKLAELVQEAGIASSKKGAEAWIREKLADCITKKPQERSIERI